MYLLRVICGRLITRMPASSFPPPPPPISNPGPTGRAAAPRSPHGIVARGQVALGRHSEGTHLKRSTGHTHTHTHTHTQRERENNSPDTHTHDKKMIGGGGNLIPQGYLAEKQPPAVLLRAGKSCLGAIRKGPTYGQMGRLGS